MAERLKNKPSRRTANATCSVAWCESQGHVNRPCAAAYAESAITLIERGHPISAISMSAIHTWIPDDKKPGIAEVRSMLNKHKEEWNKRVGGDYTAHL